jgi:methylmalonyl-CoA mutase N-terminal domain/subunit
VVRVAVQALAAVLGGTQSLHTNGYDEALSLPTAEAATLALRTQQVIAHESGATATADPLGGSYYVEHLTTELERRAMQLMERVDALGGSARAIAAAFFQDEIARSAYEHQLRVESGENIIVGVNKFTDGSAAPDIPTPDYSALERAQIERVRTVRAKRPAAPYDRAMTALANAAAMIAPESDTMRDSPAPVHLMPLIIDAVRARATVGEISDLLASHWGRYRGS